MSEKRRDNKGRILRDGELQRKDGMYEFRYTDLKGDRRSIYSWKLVETDKTPSGKRKRPPLRELEKEIQKDLDDGICTYDSRKKTVNDSYEDLMQLKITLKPTTLSGYEVLYKKHVRDTIGSRPIGSIRYSDIKKLYLDMIVGKNLSIGLVTTIHCILKQIFRMEIKNSLIRSDPTDGVLVEIKRTSSFKQPGKRKALTVSQQTNLMEFIRNSEGYSFWEPLFTLLLGTGMRIGEAAGLTWKDVDFENGLIRVRNNLQYCKVGENKFRFHVFTPKSDSGIRVIPMLDQVRDSLYREWLRQLHSQYCIHIVDGVYGFIFSTKQGRLISANSFTAVIKNIVRDFNKENPMSPLPHFSAHNLRHTFCTRLCEYETNLKVIQSVMGHSSINVTMDVYNDITSELKNDAFLKLNNKIVI